ncbi:hypothetical protein [Stygiolobus azoricus]|uniref:hypothetical protein n=1 Tax=Stygiolobus azoricus TaxID=41675 RepID=UPI0018C89D3D|nr:hypothetical protein [Stygiolobus azoricus]
MGVKTALVMLTQMVGQPLGVTLADNELFVEMDSVPGSIFAINPVTGIWYATGLASYAMNNPIVWNGIVFLATRLGIIIVLLVSSFMFYLLAFHYVRIGGILSAITFWSAVWLMIPKRFGVERD